MSLQVRMVMVRKIQCLPDFCIYGLFRIKLVIKKGFTSPFENIIILTYFLEEPCSALMLRLICL